MNNRYRPAMNNVAEWNTTWRETWILPIQFLCRVDDTISSGIINAWTTPRTLQASQSRLLNSTACENRYTSNKNVPANPRHMGLALQRESSGRLRNNCSTSTSPNTGNTISDKNTNPTPPLASPVVRAAHNNASRANVGRRNAQGAIQRPAWEVR